MIYLADTGQHGLFIGLVRSMPYGDKLGHLVLFGLLALLANVGTRFRITKIFGVRLFTGTLFVSLFMVVEELSQCCFPTRTLDAMDLFADFVGVLSFAALSLYLRASMDRQ